MDDSAFRKACMGAFAKTCAKYEAEIGEHFISQSNGFNLRSIMLSPNFPNFEARFENRTYTSRKSENVGKAIGTGGGTWAGAEAGFIAGALLGPIGAVTGGLVGAAIGGWLIGKAGGAIGENFNETETVKTQVGDNRGDVAVEVSKVLIETSVLYMEDISLKLNQLCFENLEDWIKKIQTALKSFRRELEAQIKEIDEELTHDIA